MSELALPPELAAIRGHLPEMVADLERHAPYGAVLATSVTGQDVVVTNREQRVSERERRLGAVFSTWNGEFLQERAVGSLTLDDLRSAAQALSAETQVVPGAAPEPGTPLDRHYALPVQIDPTTRSAREKLELCRHYHGLARALDPRIVNAQVTYGETLENKIFANRTRLLSQTLVRTRFLIVLFVSDGQRMEYDRFGHDGTGGLELASASEADLTALRDSAVALLSATRIEPGFYDCIFDSSMSGVMAHEAFGHGVETDMFYKGRAKAAEYLGKRVGSPLVNLMDDPTAAGGYGSYAVDDEGQVATPTTILRGGVFEQGLTDLYSSFKLGIPRTANGRRESVFRKAFARMSNTFFQRGETPVEEMIAGLERGVLLRKSSSGMEDPKGWGVQVEASYGEEIVGGKRTGRIFAPVGVTGYVPDILAAVSAVGNDFELDGGTCGKGWKDWVPVSSGGPHVRTKARLG